MSSDPKKVALLARIQEQNQPIGIRDLLVLVGDGYAERSVRRWLAQMAEDGLIEKVGQKRGTRYRALASPFTEESGAVIAGARLPLYERSPVAYDEGWFNAYQPNQTFYIPKETRKKLYNVGKRSKDSEPAGTYARHIFNRLLIDLSFNSSRLEGNTYSLLDTEKLLLEGESPEGKLDEEKVMILNHKEAIRYLVDNASRLTTDEKTIYTLHYLLSDGLVESRYAGKVRDHGVRIGGSTYIPYEDPKKLQKRLAQICEKAKQIEDCFEQSFFLLVHMTYLQAFVYVNKRTARLAANIPLVKNNYVPLSFNDVQREDYISSVIAFYELQEVGPMVDLYVFSYLRTCELYGATVAALGFDEVRVRYRQERRMVLREIILQQFKGQALEDFISSQAAALVEKNHRGAFIEDIQEDLEEMDETRIAGLGVTPGQLDAWIRS